MYYKCFKCVSRVMLVFSADISWKQRMPSYHLYSTTATGGKASLGLCVADVKAGFPTASHGLIKRVLYETWSEGCLGCILIKSYKTRSRP